MSIKVTDACGTEITATFKTTGDDTHAPGWVFDATAYECNLCKWWGGDRGTWYRTYVGTKRYDVKVWVIGNVYSYNCPATPCVNCCTACLEGEYMEYKNSKYMAVEEGIGPIGCMANSDQNYPPTRTVCLLVRLADNWSAEFFKINVYNWQCR